MTQSILHAQVTDDTVEDMCRKMNAQMAPEPDLPMDTDRYLMVVLIGCVAILAAVWWGVDAAWMELIEGMK